MARNVSARRVVTNSGRPRRPMDWICGELTTNDVTPGLKSCHWLIPPSQIRDRFTDPTLMATMSWGAIGFDDIAMSGAIAGFGIIVWNAASDTDPTGDECPGPLTDCDADWQFLWYDPRIAGEAPGVEKNIEGPELLIRSQAKRRLGNDKGILLVAETQIQAANFHWHVRALIKE